MIRPFHRASRLTLDSSLLNSRRLDPAVRFACLSASYRSYRSIFWNRRERSLCRTYLRRRPYRTPLGHDFKHPARCFFRPHSRLMHPSRCLHCNGGQKKFVFNFPFRFKYQMRHHMSLPFSHTTAISRGIEVRARLTGKSRPPAASQRGGDVSHLAVSAAALAHPANRKSLPMADSCRWRRIGNSRRISSEMEILWFQSGRLVCIPYKQPQIAGRFSAGANESPL